jgi:ATP-dependent helicase/nuclease subunit A
LREKAPAPPPAPIILRPSATADDQPGSISAGDTREIARLRGTLAHRLLQSLPDIPVPHREKAAAQFLSRRGKKLSADQRATLFREVLLLLENEKFAELFVPGSRAEVPVVGKLCEGVLVSGQIDRLSVTQDAVLIADFKTDRLPPRRIEQVPTAYIRQLAAYRAVLQKLYADRPVRAALIWTEAPDLMELSVELLDRVLADHVAARAP